MRRSERILHQRRKQLQNKPKCADENIHGKAVVIGYFAAFIESFQEILLDIGDTIGFIEPRGAFKVKIKAAIIEVYRADNADFIVAHKAF